MLGRVPNIYLDSLLLANCMDSCKTASRIEEIKPLPRGDMMNR